MNSAAPVAGGPSARAGLTIDGPDDWHRVHPVSPFVRGWVAVAAVLVIFTRNFAQDAFSGAAGGSSGGGFDPARAPVAVIITVVAAAVVVFGGGFYLSWRFTRYQVTDEHVHVNSGVVFRRQRRARIDRVQAIEVRQPLLARVFGLAELNFDVADAGKSAMRLAYLRLEEARRLRAGILARAAGVLPGPEGARDVPEAPENTVLELPPARILGAVLLGGTTIGAVAVLAVTAVAVGLSGEPAVVVGFVPVFLGLGAAYWKAFSTDFNFRIALSADGVRLYYGLLETRAQTIPPGRVQAVGIRQGLLWRPMGWYRVHVNVAGYGADREGNGSRTVLLPAGTRDQVLRVLALVFPDPGVPDPVEVFAAGMSGTGTTAGFLPSPPRARWIDPLAWRRNAVRATDTALLCRSGVLHRSLDVVPHERTQSLSLQRGPVMAVLGLVNFELHSTAGPLAPKVAHMDLAIGRRLFDEQAARAATARRIARPERWLEQEQPHGH